MAGWNPKSFEEVVAKLDGQAMRIALPHTGTRACPSPHWDSRTHRVALVGGKPTIQVMESDDVWVKAALTPPSAPSKAGQPTDGLSTKTSSILFMDVSGWSKLTAAQIHDYVVKAMPKLAEHLSKNQFLNTWGDAIVATFDSAKTAAEAALNLQGFFKRSYAHEGIAAGLACRVSLHVGETIVVQNALTNKPDIFGHAVHIAARLEPATAPGYVFCTQSFAERLQEVADSAPRPWPLGIIELPKGFGSVDACVVTWPNESDPRPALAALTSQEAAEEEPALAPPTVALSEADIKILLAGWLNKLDSAQAGSALRFSEVDRLLEIPSGSTKALVRGVVQEPWEIATMSDSFIILKYHHFMGVVVSSEPRRMW